MIRIMVVLWAVLAAGVGVGLFLLKHEVQSLEDELVQANHAIRMTQESIHVLKAEWSFLNDPVRLHRLAERHLGMTLLKPGQVIVAAALPFVLDALEQSQPRRGAPGNHLAAAPAGEGRAVKMVTTGTAGAGRPVPPLPTRMSPSGIPVRVMAVADKRTR